MEDFRPLQLKHYLVIKVANQKFAIDILDVESIHASGCKNMFEDMDDLMTAVRRFKRLVPVINLRKRLNLKETLPLNPSLIFLKTTDFNNPFIGIQVDEVMEMVETMVPKKPNGKTTRLIKTLCGLHQEVLMVLRIKDILYKDSINTNPTPILN